MTNSILAFAAPVQAESIPAWIWLLLVAAGIVATVTDVRHTRIPNWLTLPLLAAGLLYGFMHAGLPGLGHAALGAVAAGLVMVIGYIMFGGGAGGFTGQQRSSARKGADLTANITIDFRMFAFEKICCHPHLLCRRVVMRWLAMADCAN
ncbi:MAG: prepilin peptidase [Planctomycetes bacterium]|nr:prepilin peptidase [Planctomycetota bacterium]